MEQCDAGTALNERWIQRIKDGGADFVCFVDISAFPKEVVEDYTCAVLFGKALSRPYIRAIRDGVEPQHKEVLNVERKMDALAVKVAAELETEGFQSTGKLKVGRLPHKTVALRAGLGFIGKNNLLVTPWYGCAQMLGKVLTTAPFAASRVPPAAPQCGDCRICVDACPHQALRGTEWSLTTTREEIITRKLCTLCVKCMACCPHTLRYASQDSGSGDAG